MDLEQSQGHALAENVLFQDLTPFDEVTRGE